MSLIAWLEASTFIKVYGLHSPTGVIKFDKCFPVLEDDERDKRLTVATSEREMQTLREISRIS